MISYTLLKHLHGLLVLTSLLLFAWRGLATLAGADWRRRWPLLRHLPHLVDTLLLVAGVSLAVWSRQSPTEHAWLMLKLVLLLAYILAGVQALRPQTPRTARLAWFALACTAAAWMVSIGLTRQPFPWLG